MFSENQQRVIEESRRFRAALPTLLKQHAGKWVAFLHGQVQYIADEEDDAYLWALERYGLQGGFVIAPVDEDQSPRPATFEFVSAP